MALSATYLLRIVFFNHCMSVCDEKLVASLIPGIRLMAPKLGNIAPSNQFHICPFILRCDRPQDSGLSSVL